MASKPRFLGGANPITRILEPAATNACGHLATTGASLAASRDVRGWKTRRWAKKNAKIL